MLLDNLTNRVIATGVPDNRREAGLKRCGNRSILFRRQHVVSSLTAEPQAVVVVAHSSNDLIAKAIGGDEAALSLLLVQQHDGLLRYIRRRITVDDERYCDPEDVLQDTFTLAFQQIHTLRQGDDAAFTSWLMVIAQNRLRNIADMRRSRKRGGDWVRVNGINNAIGARQPADADDGFATDLLEMLARNTRSPRSVAGNREYVTLIRQAIGELEPAHRDVLRMRFVENMPHAEIADQLGRTEPAIRQLCLRALRRLREVLPFSASGS